MILSFIDRRRKIVASLMLSLIYFEIIVPAYALGGGGRKSFSVSVGNNKSIVSAPLFNEGTVSKAPEESKSAAAVAPKSMDFGGPTQPESQTFRSVTNDNMVDLFTGDFKYTIPLVDVGGYPLALGYNSGISMDQEASWVGLGWTLNPGAITRNLRGIPDDFNGKDTISKTLNIKENKTIGATATAGIKLSGFPIKASLNLGLFYNNYRGWGMESGASVGLNAASKGFGTLTAGLSVSNNTHDGISLNPSLELETYKKDLNEKGGYTGHISVGLSYNTRSGLKSLQYSAGIRQYIAGVANRTVAGTDAQGRPVSMLKQVPYHGQLEKATLSSSISFVSPTFSPGVSAPFTTEAYNGRFGFGGIAFSIFGYAGISGYVTRQFLAKADQYKAIPAYGYLNMHQIDKGRNGLMDYGRERDIPVKEDNRNIALPYYSYDVFSISGEGSGGMFRAHRGDVGFVSDHPLKTKSIAIGGGLEFGFGQLFTVGVDFNRSVPTTATGPWMGTGMASKFDFQQGDEYSAFEPSYFINAGEMGAADPDYLESIGGTDLVYGDKTGALNVYRGGRVVNKLDGVDGKKYNREKRTQTITYLTADEASTAGVSKFIENYPVNSFPVGSCGNTIPDGLESELGYTGEIYDLTSSNWLLDKRYFLRTVNFQNIQFNNIKELLTKNPELGTPVINTSPVRKDNTFFAVRFKTRMRVSEDGTYKCSLQYNDMCRFYINGVKKAEDWQDNANAKREFTVNLEGNKFYDVVIEYGNTWEDGYLRQAWTKDGQPVEPTFFVPPPADSLLTASGISVEKRVNNFRKQHHISEIDVLNNSGERYIYGLPVYNLFEKEYTFSLNHDESAKKSGEAPFVFGVDNTPDNKNGNDNYFNMQETPAYAHSFLLTGIISPDYVDVTGDGISDDDLGTAVKFNYSKTAGGKYGFKWRTPYNDKVGYNDGLVSDFRDDKGSYVYGEKELWYLNSIVSKTMIATFTVGDREDLLPINERGILENNQQTKYLKEINLYSKSAYMKAMKDGVTPTPVKTVHFDYSYELCKGVAGDPSKGKLTLKDVWFSYNGNQSKNLARAKQNGYFFYYNKLNPDYNHQSSDRWGNYKNPLDNPMSSGNDLITNAEYPYALQDSAIMAKNVAAWTLDSIKLPSGGRMKVNFESDDYGFVQNKRSASMIQIAGLSKEAPDSKEKLTNNLYTNGGTSFEDYLYVSFAAPQRVSSKMDVYEKYLKELHDTIYFRLNVAMPKDLNGYGNETVACYGFLDTTNIGVFENGKYFYLKLRPVHLDGDEGSRFSPLANAAIQFMKNNLQSKTYPGSEVGTGLTGEAAIKMFYQLAANIVSEFSGVERSARIRGSARDLDLKRSYARLCVPDYKKYGGGIRVKNILIYDNWNEMTKQKESVYGTEYKYTMTNSDGTEISSGVASYEPLLGGEENPWRTPIVYKEKVGKMVPEVTSYVETPLGESLFPSPLVGYRKVTVRSIHSGKHIRSANGYTENCFYTAYDFPVIATFVELDGATRERYKPSNIGNWLKFNAQYHLTISQGFKVELNDMHGKIRSVETYAEGSDKPISSQTTYYHVDDQNMESKHLSNKVTTVSANGEINDNAQCGLDVEIMNDLRQQISRTTSLSVSGGTIGVLFGWVVSWPYIVPIPQSEEAIFRSEATTKLINRKGIVDSVVAIEKGSRVVTKNLLYDEETGGVLLTAIQNEFDDPVYTFNIPSHWVYNGMGPAYKNVGRQFGGWQMIKGVPTVFPYPQDQKFSLTSGDEIIYYSRKNIGDIAYCTPLYADFPSVNKGYVIDINRTNTENQRLIFISADGQPITGNVSFKVIRSGRRNIFTNVGTIVMKKSPLVFEDGQYNLILDESRDILNASAIEFSEDWKINDIQKSLLRCVLK
ncbi:PA14 domain-containing protein [Chitinophaga dinghuensis]|uniref:PA14 domain-containing protein n=1 Tax=Chitinophaga dinghuensis TaxID=1539050 RepID=A0A327VQB4_9BACT|nr:PA14 domain-containing protein [Chitinophaga dinghuensis]RAJ75639.1 PA14 domain-containing protein [Chitinophaga dinghuensis]